MIFLPRFSFTKSFAISYFYPFVYSIFYFVMLLTSFITTTNEASKEGNIFSLNNLYILFKNDYSIVTFILHSIIFELVVGIW
jgi:hypothetical protein